MKAVPSEGCQTGQVYKKVGPFSSTKIYVTLFENGLAHSQIVENGPFSTG